MTYQVTQEMRIAKRCAIGRKAITRPLRRLEEWWDEQREWSDAGKSALHLGEGRAVHDTSRLFTRYGECAVFDPNFAPDDPAVLTRQYDVVWSCFVANVLPPAERGIHYRDIRETLAEGGRAYIAVRSTKDGSIKGEPEQDGVRTSVGTFQRAYTTGRLLAELAGWFYRHRFGFTVIESGRHGYILVEVSR